MDILIAEDDFVSRVLLEQIIRKIGYTPIAVADGEKAWLKIQQKEIKMVITDWNMPIMDGVTLCRKIRSANFTNYIYIIIVTAKSNKQDCLQGIKAGADDYIIKPFNYEEIQVRIRSGERILKLEENYKTASAQLLQAEKLASIGQLAAGVAHEINNPIGFISSNFNTLSDYQKEISELVQAYLKLSQMINGNESIRRISKPVEEQLQNIAALENDIDIDFVLGDAVDLINESQTGIERIKQIVIDLMEFANPSEQTLQLAQLNQNLESCLNLVANELLDKVEVTTEFGDIPKIKCYPQQMNLVFTNLLVNAVQAIDGKGKIVVQTRAVNNRIEIKISDTGNGIPPEDLTKIFDPFFTTKAVGTGTGLGLHTVYNIIQRLNGKIDVNSQIGKGTVFTIQLPLN